MVDNSRNLETSPEMQGMCIGVKSTSGSVTLGLFLTFLFSFWLSSLFQRAGMFSFFLNFFLVIYIFCLLLILGGFTEGHGEH